MKQVLFYRHKIENLLSISKIVTIHYMECNKDFSYPFESHNFWELVYVDVGEATITNETGEHVLKHGELIIHKPMEKHATSANGKIAPNLFIITFECNSPAMCFFHNCILSLNTKYTKYIAEMIYEAKSTFVLHHFNPGLRKLESCPNPNLGGQQMIRTLLEQLLIKIMRSETEKSSPGKLFVVKEELPNRIVEQITNFLEHNLYRSLTIGDICKSLCYGKTYLSTLFKTAYGCSLMQYYLSLKITESKKLIREKRYNFAEISEQLCFESPGYFTKCFKRVTGITPTEYRNSIRSFE